MISQWTASYDWHGGCELSPHWLAEGSEGLLLIVENLEKVEQPDHLKGLQSELGWLKQLEHSASLLGRSQKAGEQPKTAGIDHGHLFQI